MVIFAMLFVAALILCLLAYSCKIEEDAARKRARLYAEYQKAVDRIYGIR